MLASPIFARSPLMQRLLTYLVERKLSGHGRPPKAYQVATEALGRSADFDPATDSYPRVMVGRLRGMLDRYYGDTPWVWRLRIPLGSYEIDLVARPGDETDADIVPAASPAPSVAAKSLFASPTDGEASHPLSAPPYPYTARLLITALAAALLLVTIWALSERRSTPSAALVSPPVLDVSPLATGASALSRAVGRGIDAKLRDGFRRFDGIILQSASTPRGGSGAPVADYRLDTSTIRADDGTVQIYFNLNRTADQQSIWSDHVMIPGKDLPSFEALAPVVAQVAGNFGIIANDMLRRQPDNFGLGYPCFLQFNAVRNARRQKDDVRIGQCLRATVAKAPTDPVYLDAMSLALVARGRRMSDPVARQAMMAEAKEYAERAYDSGSATTAGLSAAARMTHYAGQCAASARFARAGIALNPYDADMIGAFGQYALGCNNVTEAKALLRRSIALDSSHGSIPTVTLAFLLAERGEVEAAQELLAMLPTPKVVEPQFLLVRSVVLAHSGELARAKNVWRQLQRLTGQPQNAPVRKVLNQFILSDAIADRAVAALIRLNIAKPADIGTK